MSLFQWAMIGLGALGFAGTWLVGAFTLGRAVEQLKAALKKEIDSERNTVLERLDSERDKILARITAIELKFDTDQKAQDHNFGEVGAAMRQFIADVEKKVREVEIYGRDHYLKITDFEKAVEKLSADFRNAVNEIKGDIRDLIKQRQQ